MLYKQRREIAQKKVSRKLERREFIVTEIDYFAIGKTEMLGFDGGTARFIENSSLTIKIFLSVL